MRRSETNEFVITNLSDLATRYRLFRVRGLKGASGLTRQATLEMAREYYQDSRYIIRRLSYLLKKPVTVVEREGVPHLVVPADTVGVPDSLPVLKAREVYFTPVVGVFDLDYTRRTPQNDEICLRFLNFMIQEPLFNRHDLWQPEAGAAFFSQQPVFTKNGIAHYSGFIARVVVAPHGQLALRVDVANKYVGLNPLDPFLTNDKFAQWQGRAFIYHFGHRWYEVNAKSLSELTVAEYKVPLDGKRVPLLEYVITKSKKPIPPELLNLPSDGAVLHYLDSRKDEKAAPTGLCYPVFDTGDVAMQSLHQRSQLPPEIRHRRILSIVGKYLSHLRLGDTKLRLAATPLTFKAKTFTVPDFRLGNNTVLSVRGTPGAIHVPLDKLGATRMALLKDKRVGFYHTDPLDRQYFILPQSVMSSYGERYLTDQRNAVDALFPQEHDYQPEIICYNDLGVKRTFSHQAHVILEAVGAQCKKPGYAVVMVHRIAKRKARGEDELAACIVRKLRDQGIHAAVIHSGTTQECYEMVANAKEGPKYVPRRKTRGKLSGYLQNVALNKVLLNNHRWPFVLATSLHADLVIGIDVKHSTVGFVAVGRQGERLKAFCESSQQREQLTKEQTERCVYELIGDEAINSPTPLRDIVIHRDGKAWPSEIAGAEAAFRRLKEAGQLPDDATLTITEIVKHSPAPMRFFEREAQSSKQILNPPLGLYRLVNDFEGFVCTTGREFPKSGTTAPLQVRRVAGPMPLLDCLEDIFYLSALALTKPDDCSRYPITLKLNDRQLGDEATFYNADALRFAPTADEEALNHESNSDFFWDVRRAA